MRRGWLLVCRGLRMYKVIVKLRRIKGVLKEWKKKENVWSIKNVDNNIEKLKKAEEKLVDESDNERRIKYYERLFKLREKNLLFNQNYWGKIVRKEWFIKGDRNSSYFYWKLSVRKRRNMICKIKERNGIWIDDEELLNVYFIEEYTKRFKF